MKKEKCYNCGDAAQIWHSLSGVPLCFHCAGEEEAQANREIDGCEFEGKEIEIETE